MSKNELNKALRQYVQKNLSPTESEREFVSKIYSALKAVLGDNTCLQIGSYPRFTAITPLHDLDVLYRIGPWPGYVPNPANTLSQLKANIEKDFKNPTSLILRVELQTHSITISFLKGDEIRFSVDVVPAYTLGANEFKQDTYMVPELVVRRHAKRRSLYEDLARSGRLMNWIQSDPRGYIEVAKLINDANADFRKLAKLVKAWKWACKEQNDEFKLKSFHLEQVITQDFRSNIQLEIYDALVQFFEKLPSIIERPQILDRVGNGKYIDDYVADLTQEQKQGVIEAGNYFLQKLRNLTSDSDIASLFNEAVKLAKKSRETYVPATVVSREKTFVPRSPWARRHD
jgi:hypothetical protein